jgi:hypothetical protein
MNYFTPELLLAYGSEDEATWKEGEARWEEASDRYRAYLDTVKGAFPPGLRRIEESYYLHDATVQGMGSREGTFLVVLRLDTPPHSLLTFTYDLTAAPVVRADALPAELRTRGPAPEWLYDEIEKAEGEPPTWRQSILFSNGWEVTLNFRDVQVEEWHALLPVPRDGTAASQAPLPQSAWSPL